MLAKKQLNNENRVFFVKMVADYYRYMAENAAGEEFIYAKREALSSYKEANAIHLPPCNLIKLGLALNYSVFYYDVMKDQKKARIIADEAIYAALEHVDDLNESEFKHAKPIIELLRENLSLWILGAQIEQ